jgi:hypothetical protein
VVTFWVFALFDVSGGLCCLPFRVVCVVWCFDWLMLLMFLVVRVCYVLMVLVFDVLCCLRFGYLLCLTFRVDCVVWRFVWIALVTFRVDCVGNVSDVCFAWRFGGSRSWRFRWFVFLTFMLCVVDLWGVL